MLAIRGKSKIPGVVMYTGGKCYCSMSLLWRCSCNRWVNQPRQLLL